MHKAARRSKWQQLEEQGFTRQIDSLNRRDKKARRKNWRERSDQYRMKKKIEEGNAARILAANQAFNQPGLIESHTQRIIHHLEYQAEERESLRSSTLKEQLRRYMNGDTVRKYKFAETVNLHFGKRRKIKDFRRTRVSRVEKMIEAFFEFDDVSRLGADKRETCTLKNIRKQKNIVNIVCHLL
ncbi:hypothetical protein HHI36_009713 [Cryptolaemus montrouzieri]|uniref:Uncharacterized protein n=1 Tax=Cryptolaemus montrouzieri TaxID=559131 RepID=A0ABD2MGK0_9CUCU